MCSCKPALHLQTTPSCGRDTSAIVQAVVDYANRRMRLDTLKRVTGASYVETTHIGYVLTRVALFDEDFAQITSVRLEAGVALLP